MHAKTPGGDRTREPMRDAGDAEDADDAGLMWTKGRLITHR